MRNVYRPRGGPSEPVHITGNDEVGLYAPPLRDAFGRLRVSQPQTLFESTHVLSSNPLLWETVLTGGGSATHVPAQAAMRLTVTGTNGDKVVRQSHTYIRYQPGKSQEVLMTFVMGAQAVGVRRRAGYFDASDGIFLEQTAEGAFLVLRSSVSGTPLDNRVWQGYWNIDTFDGNGVSGLALDLSLSQILIIDLEWLGAGQVRVGFVIGGKIYYVHAFKNANVLATVYMHSGSLPARYELENISAGLAANFFQLCTSVNSEGGRQEQNLIFSRAMLTGRAVGNADLPVFSIRVATVFPAGGSRETA